MSPTSFSITKWIWAHSAKLKGFVAHPDGITRVMDLKFD